MVSRTQLLVLGVATLGVTASCLTLLVDPAPAECELLTAAVQSEATRLAECQVDADCGQVLTGTSCGCTQDRVARLDADPSWFYELSELALAQDCPSFPDTTCDCPKADGFACQFGQCAWNYIDAAGLPDCTADQGAPTRLGEAALLGDTLSVGASYSGGCADHRFTLCWPDQAFAESWPVQARLEVLNQPQDDGCQAWLTERLSFDVSPLKSLWRVEYGLGPGEIVLRLGDQTLAYRFGGPGDLSDAPGDLALDAPQ